MSGFGDREKDFENKFAHDEKINFRVEARCCKIFGLWIAGKLGLEGKKATDYAMEVVGANLDIPGYDDVLAKVKNDLAAANVVISDHILKVELDKAAGEARRQILSEGA